MYLQFNIEATSVTQYFEICIENAERETFVSKFKSIALATKLLNKQHKRMDKTPLSANHSVKSYIESNYMTGPHVWESSQCWHEKYTTNSNI